MSLLTAISDQSLTTCWPTGLAGGTAPYLTRTKVLISGTKAAHPAAADPLAASGVLDMMTPSFLVPFPCRAVLKVAR
jgi:hypothetical protein